MADVIHVVATDDIVRASTTSSPLQAPSEHMWVERRRTLPVPSTSVGLGTSTHVSAGEIATDHDAEPLRICGRQN